MGHDLGQIKKIKSQDNTYLFNLPTLNGINPAQPLVGSVNTSFKTLS